MPGIVIPLHARKAPTAADDGDGQLNLQIADIVISIKPSGRDRTFDIDESYDSFISKRRPDAVIHVHDGPMPQFDSKKKVFGTNDGPWNLYRSGQDYLLELPYGLLVLTTDYKTGHLYKQDGIDDTDLCSLIDPGDQVLMVNLLSKRRGVMLHACGIKEGPKGFLFVAPSGGGKSTMANLWRDSQATILSDDRVIARKKDGQFFIYGTPWHGDTAICSPANAPIRKILFLKHAEKNSLKRIAPAEAASRLIVCSFSTFWDKEGMEFTLELCAELAEKLPCCEFGFVPDESSLDFIRTQD